MRWQRGLFESGRPEFDAGFGGVERIALDATAWVDHAPGWLRHPDALFAELLASRQWAQRTRWMHGKQVLEPRLTSAWLAESSSSDLPATVEAMRIALSRRYGVEFDSVGFNLYRDGRDSVAWHGDRIRREIAEPVVALVALGAPRRFLLRSRGGGRSVRFDLGGGDLLVTGGRTQRTWEHSVPKVASAGPRLSIAFRHGMMRGAYGTGEPEEEGGATPPAG
jgi:alkylated DNA repair dioxygenase AlkB